jgi:hypothetical protein
MLRQRTAWPPGVRPLWLGWLAALVASFTAGWTAEFWWDRARLDLRMLSCALLAVAAWLAWTWLRQTTVSRAMFWVALGMTFGFYGDSHVGERFWWPPVPHPIVGGIVFYGLGHLAYIRACVLFGREQRVPGGLVGYLPILLWQLLALAAWGAVALTSDEHVELRIATLLYTLLVAGTPGFATALAVTQPRFAWMALGGALFLASDVLLAWQLFHQSFPGIDELTWVCYGGGEMLIVYGAVYAVCPSRHGPCG